MQTYCCYIYFQWKREIWIFMWYFPNSKYDQQIQVQNTVEPAPSEPK